ncbi:tRNA lysidine(34) synthetase TilS [Dysgonomonas sp. 216]|uniref:tRNA lysidine(34) synthetase TilS n=1 Tax=Dysgonomonas sp. 216 TaxID=2302934 RepID=UPI0013D2B057|nr:tRNA lysidine(34) synthetase TilS [Dysgonomonas sp. 216]NDW18937.1 tRNA lysidine(34) synthetase TilS [Dysgonomonas sp. 216]
MPLLGKVKNYIESQNLLSPNSIIIIGLSGGADSMALLSILTNLEYNCIAAHCNFHLRGEESNRDERFVEGYCQYKNIPYISTSFDTYAYMKEKSVSLEMAARELRYNWFETIKEEHNADYIAVGHHQDDSIETVLINLIRGTGIRGLTGIPPKNNQIVRPLLCLSRHEILDYLNENKIPFITDSTNAENIYTRNKIRLEIIPLLEKINPSAKEAISRTSEYLSEVETIYTEHVCNITNQVFDGRKIDIELLLKEKGAKTILFEILHPLGFNSDTINNIFNSISGLSGKTFYSDNFRLIKDRNFLIINEQTYTSDNTEYEVQFTNTYISNPIELRFSKHIKEDILEITRDKNTLYADLSKITYPLQIRKWKLGDKFVPLGMKGSKKLSDYFSDRKFSIVDKEDVWLLCSADNKIIWIIGERMDDRFKITEKTSDILKVNFSGK